MTTNRSKTRTVLAGLALAAIGSAGAYGIVATGADLAPTSDEQQQAGITATAADLTPAPTPPVERRGIIFNGID